MLVLVGNRRGKTTCGAINMIRACTGVSPLSLGGHQPASWAEHDLSGQRFLICAESFDTVLEKDVLPVLKSFIAPGMLHPTKKPKMRSGTKCEQIFYFASGAELHIQSYEQDVKAFQGPKWKGAWCNEPPPEMIYHGIFRGTVDYGDSFFWITGTPWSEPWMQHKLVGPAQNETDILYTQVAVFQGGSMHDNCRRCSGGYLDHDRIELYLSTLSADQRATADQGQFADRSKIAFPMVNRAIHVCPDIYNSMGAASARSTGLGVNGTLSNPHSWPIVEVIDPAEKRGLHCCWFAVSPDDYWFLVHAAKVEHGPFSGMAAQVKMERKFLPHEPGLCIMDCRGGRASVDLETQESWFDRFHKLGLHYAPSVPLSDKLSESIAVLGEWLEPRYHPAADREVPMLRICEGVTRRLKENPFWALQSFLWDFVQTKDWHRRQMAKDMVDCCLMLATYPNMTYTRLTSMAAPSRSGAAVLASSYRRTQPRRLGMYGNYGVPSQNGQRRTLWAGGRHRLS